MQEAAGNVREVENILCVRRCRGLFLGWLTRKVLFGHCSLGKSMQNIGKEVADRGEALRTVGKGGFLGAGMRREGLEQPAQHSLSPVVLESCSWAGNNKWRESRAVFLCILIELWLINTAG